VGLAPPIPSPENSFTTETTESTENDGSPGFLLCHSRAGGNPGFSTAEVAGGRRCLDYQEQSTNRLPATDYRQPLFQRETCRTRERQYVGWVLNPRVIYRLLTTTNRLHLQIRQVGWGLPHRVLYHRGHRGHGEGRPDPGATAKRVGWVLNPRATHRLRTTDNCSSTADARQFRLVSCHLSPITCTFYSDTDLHGKNTGFPERSTEYLQSCDTMVSDLSTETSMRGIDKPVTMAQNSLILTPLAA